MPSPVAETVTREFRVAHYALAETLRSGQAFRWTPRDGAWEGVIGTRWVRLAATPDGLRATAMAPVADWSWLREYLQLDVDLPAVLATFPRDPPLEAAVAACPGLRLLRQDLWECTASFILSATKQIVQIQQIVALLCERFGEPVAVPAGHDPVWSFPPAARLAVLSEADLRACKMGFRAPKLLAAARLVAAGDVDLASIAGRSLDDAREELQRLPGVGPKIADCALLFGGGFAGAFPVDVWVRKVLQHLYFPRRRPDRRRLEGFIRTHFGPHAGYAQQYLFHHARLTRLGRPAPRRSGGGRR